MVDTVNNTLTITRIYNTMQTVFGIPVTRWNANYRFDFANGENQIKSMTNVNSLATMMGNIGQDFVDTVNAVNGS